jgi:hypothetical protein
MALKLPERIGLAHRWDGYQEMHLAKGCADLAIGSPVSRASWQTVDAGKSPEKPERRLADRPEPRHTHSLQEH